MPFSVLGAVNQKPSRNLFAAAVGSRRRSQLCQR